jgi:hypothetical protein
MVYSNDALQEISQRVNRIETRLTSLCLHMGLDPTKKTRVEVLSLDPPRLAVSGLDISLANLLDGYRRSGITVAADVVLNGTVIASFHPCPIGDLYVQVHNRQRSLPLVREADDAAEVAEGSRVPAAPK